MGMKDARFDRPRTGQAAGDARPASDSDSQPDDEEQDVARARDWTRRKRARSTSPLIVNWVDEKGAVVRLISFSTDSENASSA
jgi:hypothetical protein